MMRFSFLIIILVGSLPVWGQTKHLHGFSHEHIDQDSTIFYDYQNKPYKLITVDSTGTRKTYIYKDSTHLIAVDTSDSFESFGFSDSTNKRINQYVRYYTKPTKHEGEATIHVSLLFNPSGQLEAAHILDAIDYGCFKTGRYQTPDKIDFQLPLSELPEGVSYFELELERIHICYCTCLIKKK